MTGQQAVRLIDQRLDLAQQRKLNDLESTIIQGTWEGSTYRAIADRLSYDLDYIKQIAARLWKVIALLLGENICKNNIQSVIERYQASTQFDQCDNTEIELQTIETWIISDQLIAVAFLYSEQNISTPQPLKLDLQVQDKIESLIWHNLQQPVSPNILMDQLLSILSVRNSGENSVNCLIVNCHFDRHSNSDRIY